MFRYMVGEPIIGIARLCEMGLHENNDDCKHKNVTSDRY